MKKHIIAFMLSFTLGLLLCASMAAAKQTGMSTYYPSSGGQYSKVLLMNGNGGPDANNFCAQKADGTYGTPGDGSTFINAGTIFTDQYSGYMEICKSDGSVASYVGACLNRFSMDGTTPCPNHYTAVVNQGSPFPGATSYSCCFSNLSADKTGSNGIARSGCFSIFSSHPPPTASVSNPLALNPPPCSSVDSNAYDMGCQSVKTGCSAVRTCCFNSGNGALLGQSSSCPSVSDCCTSTGCPQCGSATCTDNCGSSCACVPATCASLGYDCGSSPDGCGGTLSCGNSVNGLCEQQNLRCQGNQCICDPGESCVDICDAGLPLGAPGWPGSQLCPGGGCPPIGGPVIQTCYSNDTCLCTN